MEIESSTTKTENTFYFAPCVMCFNTKKKFGGFSDDFFFFGEKLEGGRNRCDCMGSHTSVKRKERKLKIQHNFFSPSSRLNETINEASLALMMSLKINFYLEQEEEKVFLCVADFWHLINADDLDEK
jgi:hypothetical protein